MIRIIMLVGLLGLASCTRTTTPTPMVNANPSWNPSGGLEHAEALCRARAEEVPREEVMSGVYLASPQKRKTYMTCMKAYGFEPKKE